MFTSLQREKISRRQGFTLPELMVSTALTVVVMSQVMAALIMSQRLMQATMADMELSLQSRTLREKLLFDITEDDGGLMNVCLSDLSLENEKKGWGDSLTFKPKSGNGNNRVARKNNKKLKADRNFKNNENWLQHGGFYIQTNELFKVVATNGTIVVNLDLAVQVNNKTYFQRQEIQSQILNP